jgi:hypothetical protein
MPPECCLAGVRTLMDHALCFVLHAPRQTGTTALLDTLAKALTQEECYTLLVIEVAFIQRTTAAETGNLALIAWIHRRSAAILPALEQAPAPAPLCGSPGRYTGHAERLSLEQAVYRVLGRKIALY